MNIVKVTILVSKLSHLSMSMDNSNVRLLLQRTPSIWIGGVTRYCQRLSIVAWAGYIHCLSEAKQMCYGPSHHRVIFQNYFPYRIGIASLNYHSGSPYPLTTGNLSMHVTRVSIVIVETVCRACKLM